jgi:acetyltransferase-like isoleucine patch superfamily enzyme
MKNLFREYFFLFFRKYIKTVVLFFYSIIGLMKWRDFFSRWELIRRSSRLKVGQTIYINFRTLPFNKAIQIPILIYGKTTFISLKGNIHNNCKTHYGMLKIGVCDPIRSYDSANLIDIEGNLLIDSGTVLRQGIKLRIAAKSNVVLQKNVYIGDNNTIIANELIHFGANTRVGNNTTFMDNDFHFMVNMNTREIKNNVKAIIIGENNWIGGWSTVKKGTKTPTGTIIAGPYSMVSKDYGKLIKDYSIIGGSPAKLLAEGYRRVNSIASETNIYAHYALSNSEIYSLDTDTDIEHFCIAKSNND